MTKRLLVDFAWLGSWEITHKAGATFADEDPFVAQYGPLVIDIDSSAEDKLAAIEMLDALVVSSNAAAAVAATDADRLGRLPGLLEDYLDYFARGDREVARGFRQEMDDERRIVRNSRRDPSLLLARQRSWAAYS